MSLDLLKNLGGGFDLMRIGGASALIIYPSPYIYNAFAHGMVPEPASFGSGYALVIAAVAAAIGGKEMALAKATATASGSQ
jgi:hypothetical protein